MMNTVPTVQLVEQLRLKIYLTKRTSILAAKYSSEFRYLRVLLRSDEKIVGAGPEGWCGVCTTDIVPNRCGEEGIFQSI